MRIPDPGHQDDGGLSAVAAAGGLHHYQLHLHEAYGPVVRFQLPGADTAVSVADPVLLEATAHLDTRPEKLFAFLDPLCEAGNLQVLPADEHTPWRRLLLSVLAGRPAHERHFARFTELARELADRWAGQVDGEPVDLQKELTALSLQMICGFALGGAETDTDRVVAAFEEVLTEHLGRLYQVPRADPRSAERAEAALAYLRATVDRVVAAHRSGDRTGRSDLIGALIEAGQSPARIRDTVMMTLLAAHHTTGVAVSWTLHLLGRHPDVADRVAAELDQVLGGRDTPDYGELRRLTFLDMVLKESMRLFPPGPYGARETTEDLVLGPYEIPAGTTVFYPFWAVHLNPEHWPEPERFDPERFTPQEVAKRPRLAYVPFGIGPRSCEGAALATVEAQLVLAVLLKRLRFRPAPGHEVTPVERFVLWAREGIRMTVRPRGL
ncbi:cytochrome P450 [Streptomyces angustmyceticus]|uniref:Cytochrome P450 n=1 Tax=Streptomyces angustmyceticus TaxID=285578 RepID=A0A5J4LNM9_9ACTN|nr:cytochrome P450 [Streptomyces angustmyceticus]UAL65960.1 cytochrome P450 [Streptomyces angustmyceticus]GES33592.1 cytochrome P450 [Streptomyces angustmyceticus]